jgi:hypothetical protein
MKLPLGASASPRETSMLHYFKFSPVPDISFFSIM